MKYAIFLGFTALLCLAIFFNPTIQSATWILSTAIIGVFVGWLLSYYRTKAINRQYHSKLKKSYQEHAKIADENDTLSLALNLAKEDLNDTKKQLNQLQNEDIGLVQTYQKDLLHKDTLIDQLHLEIGFSEENNRSLNQELSSLKNEIQRVRKFNQSLRTDLSQIRAKAQTNKFQIQHFEDHFLILNDQIQKLEFARQSNIKKQKKSLYDQTQIINLKSQKVKKLENDIRNLSDQIHENNQTKKIRIKAKENEIQKWRAKYIDFVKISEGKSKTIHNLRSNIKNWENQYIELERTNARFLMEETEALEQQRKIINDLKQQIKTLHQVQNEHSKTLENAQESGMKIFMELSENEIEDNLKIIEGIGPIIESLLKSNDIFTYKQLSETPATVLEKMLHSAGPRFKIHNPNSWPEQAKLAAKQQWKTLKNYQKELKRGILITK